MRRNSSTLVYGLVSGVFAGVSGLMVAGMLWGDPEVPNQNEEAGARHTTSTEQVNRPVDPQIDPLTPLSTTDKARKILNPPLKAPVP